MECDLTILYMTFNISVNKNHAIMLILIIFLDLRSCKPSISVAKLRAYDKFHARNLGSLLLYIYPYIYNTILIQKIFLIFIKIQIKQNF